MPLVRTDGAPAAAGATSTHSVLIVDDEVSIRLICNINLTASGWRCDEAGDGEQAVDSARRLRPDLVLLDVMMPTLDGWGVAEQLAKDPATRKIPVVFLTAKADPHDRRRAQEIGAVGYLTKPINPVTLPDVLDDMLDRLARGDGEQLRAEIVDSTDPLG